MSRAAAVALAALALLAAAALAGAQQQPRQPEPNQLTPDGPATLQQRFLGIVAAVECEPAPYVLTSWSVRVGPGGRAGRVALRVPGRSASTPAVTLPATPGLYRFPTRVRSGCLPPTGDLALVQETGGHAVLFRYGEGDPGSDEAREVWRLDVFRAAAPTERLQGVRLVVRAGVEPDLDADLAGDRTQDRNGFGSRALGLAVPLRTPVTLRRRGDRFLVPVRVSRTRRVTVSVRAESGVDAYVARHRARLRRGVTRLRLPLPDDERLRVLSVTVSSPGLRPVTAGFVVVE